MKASLVTIATTLMLLGSCQPSIAQQNDFTKPRHYLGNPPCTEVACSTPPRQAQISTTNCTTTDVGKYGLPVENCPTDRALPDPADSDDSEAQSNRRYR